MFNKILIALSIVLLAQLGSATIATPNQVAQAFTNGGLIVDADYTDTGGYKILVTGLVQGTDLSPNQAFAAATVITAMLMNTDDNHNAVSIVGVSTTDGKIHYLNMNQEMAEALTINVQGKDTAAGTLLGLVVAFNNLPTLG
jgi:ABC-type glucose/galactose transport system permease subunit